MKSLTRKILLTVSGIVLAAALAVGLALAFTGSGTTFAASASGFDVGDNNYSSFGSAWSAAESGTDEYTSTIVLNQNVSPTSTYKVKEGENVILDLNGYSINIKSKGKLVDVYGTFTLKDNTATAGKYTGSSKVGVYSSSNGYMTVYEADDGTGTDTLCKYYYTSGAIYGASSSSDSAGVVMAYNGGVINMDGGSIVSNKYTPSNINTSQTATVYADTDSYFNMTGGSVSGNTTTNSVTIYLKGSGTLDGGVISGNTDDNDGTVYAGTALEIGGTIISGNTAQCGGGVAAVCDVVMNSGEICCNTTTGSGLFGSGAGIYILSGNLYMYGGTIHDNNVTSSSYGGGAIFAYGSSSTRYVVDISGGDIYGNYAVENGGGILSYYCDVILREDAKIRKNESRFGAGVYTANASPYATFTMYGGEISDNKANQSGGASYCYGTTTVYGGLVSGNTAVTGGGAFYVRTQPFAIYGGTFTGNSTSGTSTSTGGGVIYTADSSSVVTVTGGVFTDNYSAGYGGAMSFYTGSASLSGIVVTDNSAGKYAGGIYVRSNATVSFSGDVCVRSNYVGETRENVFLDSSATVTLSGALGSGSYVGVYISSSSQTQVTKAESGTSYYLEALRYFHSDVLFDGRYLGYGDSYIELKSGSDVVARVDSPSSATSSFYTSFSDALDAAEATSASGAGTAVLLKTFNVPSYSGDAWYEVGASYFLTLDLNGYDMVLDSESVRAFAVSGSLTLTDSWEEY
ncbi:MAG: hypothetical protein LUD47_02180, partial [Clostridia bacterium]|nr:hypothetical protein [Clostridia bacterium]